MNFEEALNIIKTSEWIVQAAPAKPFYVQAPARSAFEMQEILGYSYENFFVSYKDDYASFMYNAQSVQLVWKRILENINKDAEYLLQKKKQYESIFVPHEDFIEKIIWGDLSELGDAELISCFHNSLRVSIDSVGLSHLLDSISFMGEEALSDAITKEYPDHDVKKILGEVIHLDEPTFTIAEENELREIKKMKHPQDALKEHVQKYWWLQNSFFGHVDLDSEFFKKRMNEFSEKKEKDDESSHQKYSFSEKTQLLIEIIQIAALWQDQRKVRMLQGTGVLGKVIQEVARRTGMNLHALEYLGWSEVQEITSLSDFKKLESDLEKRLAGVIFYIDKTGDCTFIDEEYQHLNEAYKDTQKHEYEHAKEVHGKTAMGGKAKGIARLCVSIDAIKNFQEGEIMIAPMTRPEYLLAMKKAAAIITDEGGITSHAAIVSRELGIPCIIGTKHATRIFKDGDEVDVNADEGWAKIAN